VVGMVGGRVNMGVPSCDFQIHSLTLCVALRIPAVLLPRPAGDTVLSDVKRRALLTLGLGSRPRALGLYTVAP
jgi:hypothetical protein